MATHAQRTHVVHLLDYLHAHAGQLLYPASDVRTVKDGHDWHLTEHQLERVLDSGGMWQGDCSEFCSYVLKCCGLWPWSTPGYTGSHLKLLHDHYQDGKKARPGALVVFGLDKDKNGLHEAIVHTADPSGGDPVCATHGGPGLGMLRVSQIAVGELAGFTYLSIARL